VAEEIQETQNKNVEGEKMKKKACAKNATKKSTKKKKR
jgi:hypothetical protein